MEEMPICHPHFLGGWGAMCFKQISDFCKKEEHTQNSTHLPDRTLRNYTEIFLDTMIFEMVK